jgi:hypothetical protein
MTAQHGQIQTQARTHGECQEEQVVISRGFITNTTFKSSARTCTAKNTQWEGKGRAMENAHHLQRRNIKTPQETAPSIAENDGQQMMTDSTREQTRTLQLKSTLLNTAGRKEVGGEHVELERTRGWPKLA